MGFYESIKRKARKAAGLSWGEWVDLVRAWWLLLYIDLALRTRPFPKVRAWAARQKRGDIHSNPWPAIETLKGVLHIAKRNHLYRMGCLREALTLQRLLGARGIPAALKIGVKKEGLQFEAHAWLEFEGKAIGEPETITEQFAPLIASELS